MTTSEAQIRTSCTRGPCTLSRAEPARDEAGTTRTAYQCLLCGDRWEHVTTPNGIERMEKSSS